MNLISFKVIQNAIFFSILILLSGRIKAQSLSLNVSKTNIVIDSISYPGYTCKLEFDQDNIKKEWWRYIKSIAVLNNFKTHYILAVPPGSNESNTPVKYISKSAEGLEEATTDLSLALKPEDMNAEDFKRYDLRARDILLDFQIQLYTKYIQDNISDKEKEASKVSTKLDKYNKRILLLQEKIKSQKGDVKRFATDLTESEMKKRQLLSELKILQADIEKAKKRLIEIK